MASTWHKITGTGVLMPVGEKGWLPVVLYPHGPGIEEYNPGRVSGLKGMLNTQPCHTEAGWPLRGPHTQGLSGNG